MEKSKADYHKREGHKPYELVCIKDGARMLFWDDGPGDPMKAPNPARAKLIAALFKRDNEGRPIFASEKPGQKIWDSASSREIHIPVIDDAFRAAMVEYGLKREQAAAYGRQAVEAKRAEVAAQKEAAAQAAGNDGAKQAVKNAAAIAKGGA
jgi:hypothetical protein